MRASGANENQNAITSPAAMMATRSAAEKRDRLFITARKLSTGATYQLIPCVSMNDLREAAIIVTGAPGAYIAVVRGSDQTTGIGLVEIYNLEQD